MIQGRLLRLENFCISLTFSREFVKALPSRFDVECAALTFLRDGWLLEAESSFLARTTSRWSFWIVYLKNIKKGVFQFSSWFQSAIDVTAKRKRPCSAQVFASVRTTLHRLLWTLFPVNSSSPLTTFFLIFLPGFSNPFPFFYPVYLTILLVHREFRDEANSRRKYGASWDEYCRRVPYRILPKIF